MEGEGLEMKMVVGLVVLAFVIATWGWRALVLVDKLLGMEGGEDE